MARSYISKNVPNVGDSSLTSGATSLFGIRADLQFGKLSLQTVVSQKISESTSVSSKGGSQLTEFEIDVVDYDENRHFFLAHYFRETYDRNMAQLPTIMSGVVITRVELWVTNKTSSYDSPRNVIAFTDLGEPSRISNSLWKSTGERMPNATWDLMMKNIYYLGANSITSKDFKLNIECESDSTGTNLTYLPEDYLYS